MSVWKDIPFAEAGIELIDCIHKTPKAVEEGFPYIGIPQMKTGRVRYGDARKISKDDFLKWTEKVCPTEHDVIVSRRTNPGVSAIFKPNEKFALGQNLVLLRSDGNTVLPEFLRWMVHGPYWWAQINKFINVGAIFDSLRCGDFKDFELPIPPKNEQKKISTLLAALDDKIELNRQMNQTLESMAQAIFKDWFVDFGPSLRKSQGEIDPIRILGGLISEPKRAADIAAVFPSEFDDQGLPQGWRAIALDEIADFLNGAALQKFPAEKGSDSLPVIKIAQLRNGVTEKANRASLDIPEKFLVENGDFLFSWSGSLLAKFWTEGQGALNQHLFKVTSDKYPKWFFSQWVYHHMREFQMIAKSKATTMGHIKRQHLTEAKTVCPPDADIAVLSELLGPIIDCSIQNELENQTLAETRDYLLPKLMSGEVRVGDAVTATIAEASNLIPLGSDLFDRKALPADKDLERDSAIVAGVIAALQKDTEVVGNVKYQKGCYFVYRRMGYSTRDFEQKAAGPYSRKIVDGGYARAISQKYIRLKSDPKYPGNLPARNINDANALAKKYKLGNALEWVKRHLSGKSRGELELWATVDYAMVALRNRRTTPTADTLMDYIRNEPEWAAKLKKSSFTKSKINAAIAELNKTFPNG